jgi:hypothetical protein
MRMGMTVFEAGAGAEPETDSMILFYMRGSGWWLSPDMPQSICLANVLICCLAPEPCLRCLLLAERLRDK